MSSHVGSISGSGVVHLSMYSGEFGSKSSHVILHPGRVGSSLQHYSLYSGESGFMSSHVTTHPPAGQQLPPSQSGSGGLHGLSVPSLQGGVGGGGGSQHSGKTGHVGVHSYPSPTLQHSDVERPADHITSISELKIAQFPSSSTTKNPEVSTKNFQLHIG